MAKARPGPINRLLRPIRVQLILVAVLAALGTMLTLVPLAGIAEIGKVALEPEAMSDGAMAGIWRTVTISIASLALGMALISAAEFIAHLIDNAFTRDLRIAIARRLSRVPLGWFTDRASGEVKQAMQDDIGTLHELIGHYYTTLGRTLGAITASVIYLFVTDWRMAIVSLLPFPGFYLIFGAAKKAISAERMSAFVSGQARINSAVVEFVNGMPVIKAFGATGRADANYREAVEAFLDGFLTFTRPLVKPLANANALVAPVSVLAVVLAFGTLFVHLGWIAAVEILPFALVAPGIAGPLLLHSFIGHAVAHATAAAERVEALLVTPELPPPETPRLPNGNMVRFEGVGHAYREGEPILSGIDITLAPGTVTAVVGSSGAGKSTIARLLLRFFDPAEGAITLGGVDLRHIESQELYRRIGFVLQDVRLIHASVAENISLGRPSASGQEIEAAARAANIHDRIIALPRGYDSVIGEDARLSGGEQQRVSIARAIMLDPPVLVLDEATAAADAENEAAIQETLSTLAADRTVLVIAHRLDTISHADQILVLEDGAIRERGNHAGLLVRDGRYARLWNLGGYAQAAAGLAPSC